MPLTTELSVRQPQSLEAGKYTRARLLPLLKRIDNAFKITARKDLENHVNWGGNVDQPIHRWLRYREAYSPQLIDALSLGEKILDPFCGCGSILLGAAQRKKKSVGLDINPLAAFAARVKLTPLAPDQIRRLREFQTAFPTKLDRVDAWPLPELSIAEKVFEPDIRRTLMQLRSLIDIERCRDERCGNFLHLAWIAILETVGSYFKEGNGIKYRNKKRQRGRYTERPYGEWQRKRFGDNQKEFVVGVFAKQLQMMLDDVPTWRRGHWSSQEVHEENALSAQKVLGRRKFDSIVFSPPYANRFDYFESLKVELWFGGFISSYAEGTKLRKASVRSHLGADLKRPTREIEDLELLIGLMDTTASSWRMGVPSLLRGFFDDMLSMLEQSRRLAPSGTCNVVVGNSAFAGVIIPTDTIIAQLGKRAGFQDAEILTARHLTVAPQQRSLLAGLEGYMRESVVVLR